MAATDWMENMIDEYDGDGMGCEKPKRYKLK